MLGAFIFYLSNSCLPVRVVCVCVCVCLTFAGVRGGLRPVGVSVEAQLALLALPPLGVVQAVAHASAALARLAPRRPVEMAAQSVAVALTLWREREGEDVRVESARETEV